MDPRLGTLRRGLQRRADHAAADCEEPGLVIGAEVGAHGYIYGFTLTELTLPFSNSEGAAGVAEIAGNILEGFRPDEYPHLAEMAVDRAMKPGYKYGDEFEYGLDLILDGIQRAQDSV
ncbi:MAG: hypothetical protein E6I24_06050 [Chloroflexi bacterium]|nr:MAG: hypothetical protein E6I24_06050 [Chloroflexota bacterium]